MTKLNLGRVQGAQGTQGVQGSVGAQGPQGATGAQGYQGSVGPQGQPGPQGSQGVQGSTGTQGQPGAQGPQGSAGAQGYQGSVGPQGQTGAQGSQGVQGSTGSQGAQGYQGPQGYQGAAATLGDGSVTYEKLANDLVSRQSVSAANVDWNAGGVFTKSLTTATTFTFSNLKLNKVITLVVSGNYTIMLPAYCKKISGSYDGSTVNYIQFHCTNAASGSEEVWYTISKQAT